MNQVIQKYDFTLEEVQKLFQMQDTLNTYIHPEWKTQGFNWGLAIVDECMEIHAHLGWKWWKDGYQVGLTEENRKQIQLEVIDILHFVVSEWARDNSSPERFKQDLNYESNGSFSPSRFINSAVNDYCGTWVDEFRELAHAVGLTRAQILETYTQKYVLNKFRQDHGYKDGTYVKEWNLPGVYPNQEDNQALELVVNTLRQGNHSTTDENLLYSELKALYNSRLNQ